MIRVITGEKMNTLTSTFTTKRWIQYTVAFLLFWILIYPWGILTATKDYLPLRFIGILLLMFPKALLLLRKGMWPNPFWPKDEHRERRVTRAQNIAHMIGLVFGFTYLITPGRMDTLLVWMILDAAFTIACIATVYCYYNHSFTQEERRAHGQPNSAL